MEKEVMEVPVSYLREIERRVIDIKGANYNIELGEKIDELLKYIGINIFGHEDNKDVLLDLVYNKMVEVKNTNQDLNSMLYILYKNLKNNKISTDKGWELFNLYVKLQDF